MSHSSLLLSINAESSSVKITLFALLLQQDGALLHNHHVLDIYIPFPLVNAYISGLLNLSPTLKYSRGSRNISASKIPDEISSHIDAVGCILSTILADTGLKILTDKESITHVYHRIVHDRNYLAPHVIDQETYQKIDRLTDLAPL